MTPTRRRIAQHEHVLASLAPWQRPLPPPNVEGSRTGQSSDTHAAISAHTPESLSRPLMQPTAGTVHPAGVSTWSRTERFAATVRDQDTNHDREATSSRRAWSDPYASSNCRLLGKATPMRACTVRRYAVTALILSALAISTTACGGDDPEAAQPAEPTSSATDTSSPEPTTSSPTPTTNPDAWKTKFSAPQLEAYDEALQRWESYESRSEPIWAKGQATPAAEKLFKEFFPHPTWISYFERLQGYEQVDVKIAGTPTVYWSKAKSVTKSGSGVQIQQCVNYESVQRTQKGEEIPRPAPKPQLRTIFLSQPEGYDWLIYGVEELVDGKPKTCKT